MNNNTNQSMRLQADLALAEKKVLEGAFSEARSILKRWVGKKVPRTYMVSLASLLRRADLHLDAIRILNPIVRPSAKTVSFPTASEKAEYAASLTYVGATCEAIQLLETIDFTEAPEQRLFMSFALFSQWRYEKAIPFLIDYIEQETTGSYQRLVGRVNLAAAYVVTRQFHNAGPLLESLLHETKRNGYILLFANTLELSAHRAILLGQFADARYFLSIARSHLPSTACIGRLFVEKWAAVLELIEEEGSSSSQRAIEKVRKHALEMNHFETVRECDRFLAITILDPEKLAHVYYGTPHLEYRRLLRLDTGQDAPVPSTFLWNVGRFERNGPVLDLTFGEMVGTQIRLKQGQATHRLLKVLCSDFYRPLKLTQIHDQVFPNEFFHPICSPAKVYDLISRLRKWFKSNGVPLQIIEHEKTYRLKTSESILIKISDSEPHGVDSALRLVIRDFSVGAFTARQAASQLGVSKRTVLRLIKTGLESGVLSEVDTGMHRKYIVNRVA